MIQHPPGYDPNPHVCQLPGVWHMEPHKPKHDWDFGPPPRLAHPIGTSFVCDSCGLGYVLWQEKQRFLNVFPPIEWRHETRRERKRRLGLPWWRCLF